MLNTVRDYLNFFDDSVSPQERNPDRLTILLDQLLVAYHQSTDVAPSTDAEPPHKDYHATRSLMERCFPKFGFYRWSAPESLPGDDVMMGNAIDDLADIYGELCGVLWLSENSVEADVVWHFRFGFQSHWGRHLLNLRSYLHWQLYEQ